MSALEWRFADFDMLKEVYSTPGGTIWRARRKRDGQMYALKQRIRSELGPAHDLLHEVQLLQRLSHPNLIRCLGYFFDARAQRSIVIVLEWAEGGSLRRFIEQRRTPLPAALVCRWLRQLADVLAYLHANRIIHRDMKSLNVLLVPEDGSRQRDSDDPWRFSVKLADLGISRSISEQTHMLHTVLGTPLYASPELCANKPYNAATDVWSLGVVGYELCALRLPFASRSLVGLARQIIDEPVPALPADTPRELARLIDAMLSKRPSNRPSAAVLAETLRSLEASFSDRMEAKVASDVEKVPPGIPAPGNKMHEERKHEDLRQPRVRKGYMPRRRIEKESDSRRVSPPCRPKGRLVDEGVLHGGVLDGVRVVRVCRRRGASRAHPPPKSSTRSSSHSAFGSDSDTQSGPSDDSDAGDDAGGFPRLQQRHSLARGLESADFLPRRGAGLPDKPPGKAAAGGRPATAPSSSETSLRRLPPRVSRAYRSFLRVEQMLRAAAQAAEVDWEEARSVAQGLRTGSPQAWEWVRSAAWEADWAAWRHARRVLKDHGVEIGEAGPR